MSVMQRAGWSKRTGALALSLVLMLTLAACGKARRPAPTGEVPVSPKPAGTAPAASVTVALYFADWQAQHLVPEPRQVPTVEGAALATKVVEELIAGPKDPHLYRTLPAGVRLIEPVTLENGIAYVNLSKELLGARGATGAGIALGTLAMSLTDIPGISRVQVLVEGKKGAEMEHWVLDAPMERGGIHTFPVLFDNDRAKYLVGRVNQGLDPWRMDVRQVLEWEGRMLGFTREELAAAQLIRQDEQGASAQFRVTRGGRTFVVVMVKMGQPNMEKAVWMVHSIDEQ